MMARKIMATVWNGPEEDGITQSMLSRFICCRERFRLLVVEGLKPTPDFNHRIEYGSMWHICEENHARRKDYEKPLAKYRRELQAKYPLRQEEIVKWYQVCLTQFPIYAKYWSKHKDVVGRKPVYEEETFREKLVLPSGRQVVLRGKWDSVDVVSNRIVLQENKTKGTIDETQLSRQLLFDLQTMFYLVALRIRLGRKKIGGIRYNVVRRPLSGGKGTIRPMGATSKRGAETSGEFLERLRGIIEESPEYFFMRWDVTVTSSDIDGFLSTFLVPVMEDLVRWWDWVSEDPRNPFRDGNVLHWRYPYGVYNPALESRSGELDEYLQSGSELNLTRVDRLFEELTDAGSEEDE